MFEVVINFFMQLIEIFKNFANTISSLTGKEENGEAAE